MRLDDKRPTLWVSCWMALSILAVTYDAAYNLFRPRSSGAGDLAWIWTPYNMVDHLTGRPVVDSKDGFTNEQALMNVIQVLLAIEYLYLRHTSPRASSRTPNPPHTYHAQAPLVGFAGALMTLFKTAPYFLQDCFDGSTYWTGRVATNGTWVLIPLIVCIVLGRFIANALMRDTANQIAYLEHITAEASGADCQPNRVKETAQLNGYAATPGHIEDTEEGEVAVPSSTSHPAALPLTFHPRDSSVLIVGSNRLAATRASTFLAANANVIVASRHAISDVSDEVRALHDAGKIQYNQLKQENAPSWTDTFTSQSIAFVCVTDTLIGTSARRTVASAKVLFEASKSLRIPINISDQPSLSTFTFPSVHRFLGNHGEPSNLLVAVTTNGQGCRLSGRIKREIVSRLPPNVGAAVDNVGKLRSRAKAKASKVSDEDITDGPLNSPVPQIGTPSISRRASVNQFEAILSEEEQQLRRMRWVQQMSEYYSFEHLARLKDEDLESALELWSSSSANETLPHHEGKVKGKGRILLIGSGPGHPGLLTCAAHHALKTATLILSDKLVPSEILALIPQGTRLHIAKKFPGNAEGAQNEMMELALAGAQAGEVVVRLKQGDPFVYGRGGEEVLYFREHGFESVVIPGISSALAAPLMMGIPVTQRGVAESLVMCTGVGRQGKAVQLPGYVKSRTLVMLMGVARINQIIEVLTSSDSKGRDGAAYPRHLPIGIIERASSPDQRVILSTLGEIEESLRKVDERPPGMMIVGWAALCLEGKGRVDVLDSGVDAERGIVDEWLGDEGYKIREGLGDEWREILTGVQ